MNGIMNESRLLLRKARTSRAERRISTTYLIINTANTDAARELLTSGNTDTLTISMRITNDITRDIVHLTRDLTILHRRDSNRAMLTNLISLLTSLNRINLHNIIMNISSRSETRGLAKRGEIIEIKDTMSDELSMPTLKKIMNAANRRLRLEIILNLVSRLHRLIREDLISCEATRIDRVNQLTSLRILNLNNGLLRRLVNSKDNSMYTKDHATLLSLRLRDSASNLSNHVTGVNQLIGRVRILSTNFAGGTEMTTMLTFDGAINGLTMRTARRTNTTDRIGDDRLKIIGGNINGLLDIAESRLSSVLKRADLRRSLIGRPIKHGNKEEKLPSGSIARRDENANRITTGNDRIREASDMSRSLRNAMLSTIPGTKKIIGELLDMRVLDMLSARARRITRLNNKISFDLPNILTLAIRNRNRSVMTMLDKGRINHLRRSTNAFDGQDKNPELTNLGDNVSNNLSVQNNNVEMYNWEDVNDETNLYGNFETLSLLSDGRRKGVRKDILLILHRNFLRALTVKEAENVIFIKFIIGAKGLRDNMKSRHPSTKTNRKKLNR